MQKKNVLIVAAHADDMEFMAAGTVARFIDEFHYDVFEYILTDNSRGSFRLDPEQLIRVSADEAIAAGKILGLKDVRLEGYEDGRLNEENPNVLRDKIIDYIRSVSADILMCWDPFAPYEDHPDHRAVAMAASDAAAFSGNPCFVPNSAFPVHPVTEAYWFAKHPMNAAMYVDIESTIDKKIAALLAHDCQIQLTVDALLQEARILGADAPFLSNLEPDSYRSIVEMAVRDYCQKQGSAVGYAFAELFRYQKLGMLDTLFGMNFIQTDFPIPGAFSQ